MKAQGLLDMLRALGRDDEPQVKRLMPISGGLGAGYANLDDAKAAPWNQPGMSGLLRDIDDKPLEQPVYSPIDLAVAPVGAAGLGAKALAMTADPIISIGTDYAADGAAKAWDAMRQTPEGLKKAEGLLGMFASGNY